MAIEIRNLQTVKGGEKVRFPPSPPPPEKYAFPCRMDTSSTSTRKASVVKRTRTLKKRSSCTWNLARSRAGCPLQPRDPHNCRRSECLRCHGGPPSRQSESYWQPALNSFGQRAVTGSKARAHSGRRCPSTAVQAYIPKSSSRWSKPIEDVGRDAPQQD